MVVLAENTPHHFESHPASVIETCRKRKILPWPYLATVIAERRKGNPEPAMALGVVAV